MIKILRSQRGVAHLALIVVVLVAAVGGVGYIAYQRHQSAVGSNVQSFTQDDSSSVDEETDPSADLPQ
jgi:hypothetical protein